ncbi:MAG: hypothetical protein ACM3NI_08790 [Bacteroidota bacterium]
MKKSLTSLFALAFALMFGAVHFANAEEPAAKGNGATAEVKKEEKVEKKTMKKKATKKHVKAKKEEKKEEMKEGAPAAPAK